MWRKKDLVGWFLSSSNLCKNDHPLLPYKKKKKRIILFPWDWWISNETNIWEAAASSLCLYYIVLYVCCSYFGQRVETKKTEVKIEQNMTLHTVKLLIDLISKPFQDNLLISITLMWGGKSDSTIYMQSLLFD